jgi:hypothetical protein
VAAVHGSMIEDFESSGLIDLAARNYRVIVFDRPRFGHRRETALVPGRIYHISTTESAHVLVTADRRE